MNPSITPQSTEEFLAYYQFRWKMLRQPWHQALGSEKDLLEDQSVHRMLVSQGEVIAVGRLHKTSQTQAQIRYMAVDENSQGQGLGKKIIEALEHAASQQGVTEISLNARENALGFYEKLGYQNNGFSHDLYDQIRHFSMTKKLSYSPLHQPIEAQALQKVWHNTIPMSKAMNLVISYYDQQQIITHCCIEFNQNIHHTMFAGSIYTLATLTGWGWLYLQLQHEGITGDIVLADANIQYLLPIKGAAHATTSHELLLTEKAPKCFRGLTQGKKVRIIMEVNIISGDKISAKFIGQYVILPKRETLSESTNP